MEWKGMEKERTRSMRYDDRPWYGTEEDYSRKADEEAWEQRKKEREEEWGEQ